MTRETTNKLMPVLQAYAQGKSIQFRLSSEVPWKDVETAGFMDDVEYRIKPESKYRPWKTEEIPVGAQIKMVASNDARYLIIGVNRKGNVVTVCGDYEPLYAFSNWLCSLDQGKTWSPCGVLE